MLSLDNTDVALLVIASYVAITSLVRLMSAYRDQLFSELEQKAEAERKRRRFQKQRDGRLRKQKKPAAQDQDAA